MHLSDIIEPQAVSKYKAAYFIYKEKYSIDWKVSWDKNQCLYIVDSGNNSKTNLVLQNIAYVKNESLSMPKIESVIFIKEWKL